MATGQKSLQMEHLRKYYSAQAGWTKATRNYIYRRTNILRAGRIIEVGCSTGEITAELLERTKAEVTAVDIDGEALSHISGRCPRARVIRADAANLEMPDESFDAAVCHFTLMWCTDPAAVVAEMARVIKRSGCVVAMSEPDYGGVIEHPDKIRSSHLIAGGLRASGADPEMGRKVRELFVRASLDTEVGLASAVWGAGELLANLDAHRQLIREAAGDAELEKIITLQEQALKEDTAVFFLPVFWAIGLKK